jgi:hypothetical protein
VAFRRRYFTGRPALQRSLEAFVQSYNHERPIRAIGSVAAPQPRFFGAPLGHDTCLHHSGSGQSSGAAVLNGCAMVAPRSQAIQTWRSSPPPSNSSQQRCSWLAAYVGTVLVRMVYNLVVAHMF